MIHPVGKRGSQFGIHSGTRPRLTRAAAIRYTTGGRRKRPPFAYYSRLHASVAQGQSSCFVNSRSRVQIPSLAPHPFLVASTSHHLGYSSVRVVCRPLPGSETPSVYLIPPPGTSRHKPTISDKRQTAGYTGVRHEKKTCSHFGPERPNQRKQVHGGKRGTLARTRYYGDGQG